MNTDKFLRAILQLRNSPDPDCNLFPAQIIFGRPLRDAFDLSTDSKSNETHTYVLYGAKHGMRKRTLFVIASTAHLKLLVSIVPIASVGTRLPMLYAKSTWQSPHSGGQIGYSGRIRRTRCLQCKGRWFVENHETDVISANSYRQPLISTTRFRHTNTDIARYSC